MGSGWFRVTVRVRVEARFRVMVSYVVSGLCRIRVRVRLGSELHVRVLGPPTLPHPPS